MRYKLQCELKILLTYETLQMESCTLYVYTKDLLHTYHINNDSGTLYTLWILNYVDNI